MKKRKTMMIGAMALIFVVGIYIGNKVDFSKLGNDIDNQNGKILAVYLEGADGEYALSSSNKFPTDGYVLNTEKSTCTNGGTLSQNAETKAISMSTSNKSECNLYFEKEKKVNESANMLIAKANDASITDYNSSNKGEMFAFSHPATEQTEALTDYRYIGNTPNNYIDFNDETWRIIGVFTTETENGEKEQLMKIIRDESIGDLKLDSKGSNEWSTASLKALLNGDYYNQTGSYTSTSTIKGLNVTAQGQVANVKWYLGGASITLGFGGPDCYTFERGVTTCTTTGNCSGEIRSTNIIAKVGLMYPSDYVYTYANGVDNICYTEGHNCKTNQGGTPTTGWLFKSGISQWSLSPHAKASGIANSEFFVYSDGSLSYSTGAYFTFAVRPTVFLASDVAIVDGDGSSGNHYKLG